MIPSIPPIGHVGDFASRRSFYHHPGIDLYCSDGQEIIAMEDGVVVNFDNFTGPNSTPPSPWWNETFAVLIEGASGVIGYCELKIINSLKIGDIIKAGDPIGHIIPVLKKDKGNGTTMLHLEYYIHGTRDHVTWELDTDMPKELINPRVILKNFI